MPHLTAENAEIAKGFFLFLCGLSVLCGKPGVLSILVSHHYAGLGSGRGASTGVTGSINAAAKPITANTARTIMARPYPWFPSTRGDTMTVPAIATPNEEPRFEILRDRPDISP